jgi:hypothetical protein
MVDMQMRAEHVVHLVVADAERLKFVAPALLAGEIERRRMALVLAGAGIDQDDVVRRAHHKGLVGDDHQPQRGIKHLRLHRWQMMLEHRLVIGREEILRPPPRAFAFDHRVDGDIADSELFHFFVPSISTFVIPGRRRRVGATRRSMVASPESITTTEVMDSGPTPRGRVPE